MAAGRHRDHRRRHGDREPATSKANDTDGDGTAARNTVALDPATPAIGSFRTLTLNADGSYSYALDNTNAKVQQPAPGGDPDRNPQLHPDRQQRRHQHR
ncbi:MAG: hypothetical protein IPN42_07770, partial [Methylococcaceae bacterium]|nr:hypothetical protein [Methylococcaceae bacterium]